MLGNRLVWLLTVLSCVYGLNRFNQSINHSIKVNFDSWTNFAPSGGCVTCPYSCVKPALGPTGEAINSTNATQAYALPSIYTQVKQNGCCYAAKGKSKQQPDCSQTANPADAEDCGYLQGPTLEWKIKIKSNDLPEDPMLAILFASIDCEHFWAIGETYVQQDRGVLQGGVIEGSKVINGGCYGTPKGASVVLAGCLTTLLKSDKQRVYPWTVLAEKCRGLSGQCSRTNGLYGKNLKCCTKTSDIEGSNWDVNYPKYHVPPSQGSFLTGGVIFAIVFLGVALLMCLVHYGAKIKTRASEMSKARERQVADDYEEVVSPLMANQRTRNQSSGIPAGEVRYPMDLDISLKENDEIFRADSPQILFEGSL